MTDNYLLPGQIWPRLVEQSRYALGTGALQPIATEATTLWEGETEFVVRILAHLHIKISATTQQRQTKTNPFLPYERDLFVGNFSDTHLGLLNKFNAVDHHLLIVTRQFEDQQRPLTEADFTAAVTVLQAKAGLVFYNSGPLAGASQPHRHLQWVPFPLSTDGPDFPLANHFSQGHSFPFQTAIAPLGKVYHQSTGGKICHQLYGELMAKLGLQPEPAANPHPYNLLMTREFLALIPRSRESYQGIPINSLGFAGGLLVRDQQQLQTLQSLGPWQLLTKVAVPR